MILHVFADESYLLEGNRNVIAIAGWLSTPEGTNKFCTAWKSVLDFYGVKYFHFKDFADKSHKYHKETPYDGWDELKRETFLFDLALAACELGIPVGASSAPNKPKLDAAKDGSLKAYAYFLFYQSVLIAVNTRYSPFNGKGDKIEFVFDKNDDPDWRKALNETFNAYKSKGAPFGDCHPKTDDKCIPLQAADLYVYAMRQNAERFFTGNRQPMNARMLDFILEKNRPDLGNWTIKPRMWANLVRLVSDHYREWKLVNPKKKYFPLVDCPMLIPPPRQRSE